MFGSVTSAETTGTGAYEHNFALLNENLHPTFTLSEKNGVEALAYTLASIENLKLDFAQGNFVMLDTSWKAKIGVATTLTPSYSEEEEFTARQVQVFFADDLAGLDSATAICVESGGLELIKEIEQVYCLGEVEPKEVITKMIDLQSSLTVRHKDNTFSTYQKNGTQKAMRIRMINTGVTIGVSDNPTIDIDVPQVKFNDVVKEGGRDDIVKQNITVSGLFDLSEGIIAKGKVINTTNVY